MTFAFTDYLVSPLPSINNCVACNAAQGKTSITDISAEPSSNGSGISSEKAAELISEMSPEQQKQLSQIYFFLTQVLTPCCVRLCQLHTYV